MGGKPSRAGLLFFQALSTLSGSGLRAFARLTLLTVKAGVLLPERNGGPKMREEEKKKTQTSKGEGARERGCAPYRCLSVILLPGAQRGLRFYTCQLLCRK